MAIKPPALRPADTIGILAPSWCGPAIYPRRVERGVKFFESLGYRVVVARHTFGRRGVVSGTPEERVADIHDLFTDKSVRAIISAIGGGHSCHLLPTLDWALIEQNPKIFMGFSDITVLNLAMYERTGLCTFYGPMVMTDFAEDPQPLSYTIEYLWRALCKSEPLGEIKPSVTWTDDFLYWATEAPVTPPRELGPSNGWTWLKLGEGCGRLIGGCIESMQHLRGTSYWPNMDGAVLFLETSEEKPSPTAVDAILQDYENMGVFKQIAGLLFGRPMGYTEDQRAELRSVLLERTARYSFPIVSDMDFGHTAPILTLPIGCETQINGYEQRIIIREAAVIGEP